MAINGPSLIISHMRSVLYTTVWTHKLGCICIITTLSKQWNHSNRFIIKYFTGPIVRVLKDSIFVISPWYLYTHIYQGLVSSREPCPELLPQNLFIQGNWCPFVGHCHWWYTAAWIIHPGLRLMSCSGLSKRTISQNAYITLGKQPGSTTRHTMGFQYVLHDAFWCAQVNTAFVYHRDTIITKQSVRGEIQLRL